ncbi:6795_t:CDS:2, partial [Entrophospora sp. SA101]
MSDDNNKNSIEIKVITPNDNDNNEDNGDAPTLTDIKKLGWDDKDFVKSKLCNNEISDKDKSDILKDKPKVYIDEISNNQCVVIQSEHCSNIVQSRKRRKDRIIILWTVVGKHLSCSKIYKYSKDFVKSKLCNNEISDKDKSDILKDKPKVYIDEISNNQCVVIQSEHCILFNLEKGKIIEYPKKIRNKIKHDKREKDKEKDDENDNENEGKGPPFEKEKGNKKDNNKDKGKIEKYTKVIFQNNDKSNSKLVKLMMLRRSHKDEKKYKIYSMEYNSNSGDLKLLHTHNIYSDETPRIYYDVNHFLVASSHSLISEWSHNHRFYEKSYNYEKNYYLKSNDYIVLNKKNKAEEALMVADYRRNSKLVVYSLERNIAVSSYEFKKKVYIKKVDFIYVKNDDIFSFANDENEIHKEEDNSEKQSTKGLFNDILTRYWKLTKEKVEDLSSLEDKVDKISLKYWESTIKKERKEDLEKFKHNIDKVNEVSLKEYWAKQKKKKEYLAKLKENEYLTKLENEINETNGLNQYWTSTTEKVKDLATTLEDIVNKINGVTSNQSTEKEDEISRIDDDISNQSTKKKEKEGLPKSEDEIDILEKYWTSEKSEKKEYLTKLENKIKRISDILNQSTRGK